MEVARLILKTNEDGSRHLEGDLNRDLVKGAMLVLNKITPEIWSLICAFDKRPPGDNTPASLGSFIDMSADDQPFRDPPKRKRRKQPELPAASEDDGGTKQ